MREARRYDGERVRRVGQSGSTKEGGHATSRTSVDSCRAHGTRLWGGEVAMEQPPDGPGPLRQVERDVGGHVMGIARTDDATADLVQQGARGTGRLTLHTTGAVPGRPGARPTAGLTRVRRQSDVY